MSRTHRRPGFTLIELLVSVALLSIVVVMVSQVFKISSDAAGRVSQQAELFSAAAAFREQVTDLLTKIEPGLLIIESPPPTTVRAEVSGGDAIFRLRHDRLVFIATGGPGEFESVTDPTRGAPNVPNLTPSASAQALIYVGPAVTTLNNAGNPMNDNVFLSDATIAASEWAISRRAILLGVEEGTGVKQVGALPGGANLTNWWGVWSNAAFTIADFPVGNNLALPDAYRLGFTDVISDANTPANAQTLISQLAPVNLLNVPNNPLWSMSFASNAFARTGDPTDSTIFDHYTRDGINFLAHVADLRIEWTDGRRIDPANGDLRTRWFGLKPDPNSNPAAVQYRSHMRSVVASGTHNPNLNNPDSPAGETAAFSGIEWSPGGNVRYRAIWRTDTWQFRPKALRFTFRVYDRLDRFSRVTTVDLNEDGTPDDLDGDNKPDAIRRYGQEFSIVVPLPG